MGQVESQTEVIDVRGLRYCIRHWGKPDAPKLFFLHGWMDSSPTFQFVVDEFCQSWHILAPDWRGYGASEWLGRPYWFPDYYADLDCILERFSIDQPARIVGHSMGANIASTYAGIRPQRVAQLVMVDFLGLKPEKTNDAPTLIGNWLENIRETPKLRTYSNHESLARRLMAANPRLSEKQAQFLSRTVSRTRTDGQIEMACDPWHKIPSPIPYRFEDSRASWKQIEAEVLMVVADQGFIQQRFGSDPDEYHCRLESFPSVRVVSIADSGHNVQHDQPKYLATLLEEFFGRD